MHVIYIIICYSVYNSSRAGRYGTLSFSALGVCSLLAGEFERGLLLFMVELIDY